jgi:hypothetical protein
MKTLSLFLLAFMLVLRMESSFAQEQMPAALPAPDFIANFSGVAKNSVYVEAGGNALLYSLNYDRLLAPNWSVRIGFSYLRFGLNTLEDGIATTISATGVLIPITSSYIINFPSSPHHIELGGGATVVFGSGFQDVSNKGYNSIDGAFPAATLIAAYRLQPAEGGFNLRVGITPLVLFTPLVTLPLPWLGVSFGGTFGGL